MRTGSVLFAPQNGGMTNPENAELIETLDRHRGFLLHTAQGLTEAQARTASTVSVLTIASLLKHVADTEEQWIRFAEVGAEAEDDDIDWADFDPAAPDPRFQLTDDETLDALRARMGEVAEGTRSFLATADLSATHPLPEAPWFEPGTAWSVRRVALHMIAEIAQHAGHADIIREAIDGQKTMG